MEECRSMTSRINEKKSKKFYNKIIKKFPEEKVKYYFGEERDFIESISSTEFLEEDNIFKVSFKNGLEIEFFKILFDKLFKNNENLDFNKSRNGIINDIDYTYMPFKEIDNVKFSNKIETILFLLINKNKSEFIFINLLLDFDYPDEITDYFIRTMEDSLISDFNFGAEKNFNFFKFFKPIKYLLKIKGDSTDLLYPLKYFLAKDMGLCPPKDHLNLSSEFKIDQKLDNIYDKTNNSFLIHPAQRKTEVISYYLDALQEKDPLYQFLDFYHILETYCYNFFIEYLKDFIKNTEPFEFFKNAEKLKKDEYIISKSIEFICSNELSYNWEIDINPLEEDLNKFIAEINENISGEQLKSVSNWRSDNQNPYYYHLGRLIYKVRCETAHRKIQRNPITKYIRSYPEIIKLFNLIMKKISEFIIEREELKL